MTAATRQRLIERIRALGPRALAELLAEIERYGASDPNHRLGRYAALGRGVLAFVGGDRFPEAPMLVVPQR